MDPANRAFMESISRGECPAELDPGNRTQPISVNLVKSEKPYEAPAKPKYKAFSGSGQTLAGQSLCVKQGPLEVCMVVVGLCVSLSILLPLCHVCCHTGG